MNDKVLHFASGMIIAFFSSCLFGAVVGVCIGGAAGVAKEIYDEWSYGGFDAEDLFATVAGAAIGAAFFQIISLAEVNMMC